MNRRDGKKEGEERQNPSGWNWAWEMSVGEGYRDTWACDDSDKSPRRQNKARLPQICFQCSSVGELDDGWTGTGRNASVSKLLTIIKTCSFPFYSLPFFSSHLQSPCLQPISFHFISICLCLGFPSSLLNSITDLSSITLFYPFLLLFIFIYFWHPSMSSSILTHITSIMTISAGFYMSPLPPSFSPSFNPIHDLTGIMTSSWDFIPSFPPKFSLSSVLHPSVLASFLVSTPPSTHVLLDTAKPKPSFFKHSLISHP